VVLEALHGVVKGAFFVVAVFILFVLAGFLVAGLLEESAEGKGRQGKEG